MGQVERSRCRWGAPWKTCGSTSSSRKGALGAFGVWIRAQARAFEGEQCVGRAQWSHDCVAPAIHVFPSTCRLCLGGWTAYYTSQAQALAAELLAAAEALRFEDLLADPAGCPVRNVTRTPLLALASRARRHFRPQWMVTPQRACC